MWQETAQHERNLTIWREEFEDFMLARILDFHVHLLNRGVLPPGEEFSLAGHLVGKYDLGDLRADLPKVYTGREGYAACLGLPDERYNRAVNDRYVASACDGKRFFALRMTMGLYETLAPGLREKREQWLRKDVLMALEPHAEVVFRQAVYRRPDIDAAVAAYGAQGVDRLLVVLLTYSASQLALPALKRPRLPILIWNTQEPWAVDESYDVAAMTKNHGVHGTQDVAMHIATHVATAARSTTRALCQSAWLRTAFARALPGL